MLSNLEDYKDWLDQVFTTNEQSLDLAMLEAVKFLSQKEQISSILRLILADSTILSKVASQSYLHANGFDKIVLISSKKPQYKLRLHTWWPNLNGIMIENVHNHRWDFSSIILLGAYRSQEFRYSEDGINMHAYKYFSPEGKDYYSMESLGLSKLECVFDSIMTAGSHYTLKHSVLHRVLSNRKYLTLTLILQGPVRKTFTNVFSNIEIPDSKHMDSSPLLTTELSWKLQRCLERISSEQVI